MGVRHQLIKAPTETVWSVLSDPVCYSQWVVGTTDTRPSDGDWPQTGASLTFDVRLGPWTLTNRTVVRRCAPPSELELEAHSGPLGTARIAIEVRTWGEDSLVIVDEHPLRGAGGALHNAGFEVLVQLRHRAMLSRLARLCENRHAQACRKG